MLLLVYLLTYSVHLDDIEQDLDFVFEAGLETPVESLNCVDRFCPVLTSFAHSLYVHVLAQNRFSKIEKVGANQPNRLPGLCLCLFALVLFRSLAFTYQFKVPCCGHRLCNFTELTE